MNVRVYHVELWFSPDICPGVGLLDHMVVLFLIFYNIFHIQYWENVKLAISIKSAFQLILIYFGRLCASRSLHRPLGGKNVPGESFTLRAAG